MYSLPGILQLTLVAGVAAQRLTSASSSLEFTASRSFVPSPTRNPTSQATGCAVIADMQEEVLAQNFSATILDFPSFPPSVAFACLETIPLNKTAATGLIDWYKPYLEFLSTLGWLKDPPPSYQQAGVDLIAGFDDISSRVLRDEYSNEYEFESALWSLIQSAHEGHLGLPLPTVLSFTHRAPWEFVSVSTDGLELPEVYVYADQFRAAGGNIAWTPSAITLVNGQDSNEFFTDYARRRVSGQLEPHADWNRLFRNSARVAGGSASSAFRSAAALTTVDTMNLTFANGSTNTGAWQTICTKDITGVRSGQDFYDAIVAGADQAASAADDNGDDDEAAPNEALRTAANLEEPYPSDPVTVQRGLGDGVVSGYFLEASAVAVLSVPSFDLDGELSNSFQVAIAEFLRKCRQAGMQKLVIDLQGNGGGLIFLGIELFKQLFPSVEPFWGNTLRASTTLDVVGYNVGQSRFSRALGNTLNFNNYTDAAGNDIPSWGALFGPQSEQGGDTLTNVFRFNLTQEGEDGYQPWGNGFILSGYGANSNVPPSYFAPEDILLLTDGSCASTCALFAEQMKTEVGVKSVVVGGRPSTGPMQAVSGTKGSNTLPVGRGLSRDNALAATVEIALATNRSLSPSSLPSLSNPPILMDLRRVSFNFRNQVRRGTPAVPLQFVYEAADCRIFYTQEMLRNYSVLWQRAADALWTDPSLCVQGSTGHISSGNVTLLSGGPNATASEAGNANPTTPGDSAPTQTRRPSGAASVGLSMKNVILGIGCAVLGFSL